MKLIFKLKHPTQTQHNRTQRWRVTQVWFWDCFSCFFLFFFLFVFFLFSQVGWATQLTLWLLFLYSPMDKEDARGITIDEILSLANAILSRIPNEMLSLVLPEDEEPEPDEEEENFLVLRLYTQVSLSILIPHWNSSDFVTTSKNSFNFVIRSAINCSEKKPVRDCV